MPGTALARLGRLTEAILELKPPLPSTRISKPHKVISIPQNLCWSRRNVASYCILGVITTRSYNQAFSEEKSQTMSNRQLSHSPQSPVASLRRRRRDIESDAIILHNDLHAAAAEVSEIERDAAGTAVLNGIANGLA